jgi:hypothetical protein
MALGPLAQNGTFMAIIHELGLKLKHITISSTSYRDMGIIKRFFLLGMRLKALTLGYEGKKWL